MFLKNIKPDFLKSIKKKKTVKPSFENFLNSIIRLKNLKLGHYFQISTLISSNRGKTNRRVD